VSAHWLGEAPRGVRCLAVLGAGAEGKWLAQSAARAGYAVVLEDLMSSRRRTAAIQMSEQGGVFERVAYASTVEEAVREADLVIDFVPDELESKLEIFSLLDRMAPPYTIFATPTRTLSIADLASCTYRPDRCFALRLPEVSLLPTAEALNQGAEYSVQVIHAPSVSQTALRAVVHFWDSLRADVSTCVDREPLP